MAEISPKAIVAPSARLGEGVRVGPFSVIGPDVEVGTGTIIDANVTLIGSTRVGENCRLFPGCVVGCPPQQAVGGAATRCRVAERNVIREHVIIEAGAEPDAEGTFIGPGNLLMVGCYVAHDAYLEGEGIFANFTRIDHHAHVEEFVRTSGFTGIAAYATVGAYTFTTGYAGIDRDAPPYAIVQGFPFQVRSVNVENLRRCGFEDDAVGNLKRAFRMLFDGKAAAADPSRLDRVEQSFDNEHVRNLVAAIRRSAAHPTGRWREPTGAHA